MKVGRNDPCPCGSGKKYKKCCLRKDGIEENGPTTTMDRIEDEVIGDYGEPVLDMDFLEENRFSDLSAQGLLGAFIERSDLDAVAAEAIRRKTSHWRPMYEKMMGTKDVRALVSIMAEGPDPLLHHIMIDKVLEREEAAMPLILEELERSWNDHFIELAAKVIFNSRTDWTHELVELARKRIKNPYALSLVCLILGLKGPKECTKLLWDCFHFFKEKFPGGGYEEGALIGLHKLGGRL